MSKLVIHFLLALKNASKLKKEILFVFYNRIFLKLAQFLYKEGLIQSFAIKKSHSYKSKTLIQINLRYFLSSSPLAELKIVSKPSISKFVSYKDLVRLNEGSGLIFLTTSAGFLSSSECKKKQIGGKIFFICP